MDKIILTTKNELETLIQDTFRKVISEQTEKAREAKDAILSVEQTSQFLNLAKQTLYGFTSKNEIPFFKKGKKLYFRKSELEQGLSEGKQKTLSETRKEAINYVNKKGK
jgi:excisionase family DNA binding protein